MHCVLILLLWKGSCGANLLHLGKGQVLNLPGWPHSWANKVCCNVGLRCHISFPCLKHTTPHSGGIGGSCSKYLSLGGFHVVQRRCIQEQLKQTSSLASFMFKQSLLQHDMEVQHQITLPWTQGSHSDGPGSLCSHCLTLRESL